MEWYLRALMSPLDFMTWKVTMPFERVAWSALSARVTGWESVSCASAVVASRRERRTRMWGRGVSMRGEGILLMMY
jgi:hypothetical protein